MGWLLPAAVARTAALSGGWAENLAAAAAAAAAAEAGRWATGAWGGDRGTLPTLCGRCVAAVRCGAALELSAEGLGLALWAAGMRLGAGFVVGLPLDGLLVFALGLASGLALAAVVVGRAELGLGRRRGPGLARVDGDGGVAGGVVGMVMGLGGSKRVMIMAGWGTVRDGEAGALEAGDWWPLEAAGLGLMELGSVGKKLAHRSSARDALNAEAKEKGGEA
jgi:hypothetical protein